MSAPKMRLFESEWLRPAQVPEREAVLGGALLRVSSFLGALVQVLGAMVETKHGTLAEQFLNACAFLQGSVVPAAHSRTSTTVSSSVSLLKPGIFRALQRRFLCACNQAQVHAHSVSHFNFQ